MRQLTPRQLIFFQVATIAMIVSLCLFTILPIIALCIYAVCSALFAFFIFLMRYEGSDITLLRLRRQQIFGAVCLILVAFARAMQLFQLSPLRHNEWMIFLTIGVLLFNYATWRITYIMEKRK